MTCPLICHCSAYVCLHREMKKTPGRKKRSTHATRKYNELQKERAKYVDGRGWERALKSKMDADARDEVRAQENFLGTNMPSWLQPGPSHAEAA